MPPRQAATLVLRDVLGFAADEVAGMLSTSPTAVKGTLQRARAALDEHRERTGSGRATRPGSDRERALARRFADAYVAADIDGVVALLTDDAWLSMPPAPHQYHGLTAIRSMLRASFEYRGDDPMYLVPTWANTQPALAGYVGDRARRGAFPSGLFVLSVAGARIHAITRFHIDELYPRFGLAGSLPEADGRAGYPAR
jgi:RNA polymerase sigma-70 factor (ECF subfamily)